MPSLERFGPENYGPRVVQAIGVGYLVAAVAWLLAPIPMDTSLIDDLFEFLLIFGAGVGLLYGSHRLPDFDVHPAFYGTVAKWSLGGVVTMLVLLGLFHLQPAEDVGGLAIVIVLTGLAAVAGFVGGVHSARAKTRTRELERTVEQLWTANERLEQFAYAASHDLQEPLRMVSSYLQLLENRYADDLDDEAGEYIDFAVDGADRMSAMIESLLEYSRVTTQGASFEPTDAAAVLDGARDDLRLRIEETDAEVTVGDLPTVAADPDQLAQVFRNLLDNAMRYSGDEPPRIHVSAERVDDAWLFSVADDGVGVDEQYHERIFAVFERLGAAEDADERGAGGIGLALCERIVERHGGEIWIESTPGEGATFYFTIPASEDELPTPPEGIAGS